MPLVQRVGGRTSILRSQPPKIPAVNYIPSATRLIKIGMGLSMFIGTLIIQIIFKEKYIITSAEQNTIPEVTKILYITDFVSPRINFTNFLFTLF